MILYWCCESRRQCQVSHSSHVGIDRSLIHQRPICLGCCTSQTSRLVISMRIHLHKGGTVVAKEWDLLYSRATERSVQMIQRLTNSNLNLCYVISLPTLLREKQAKCKHQIPSNNPLSVLCTLVVRSVVHQRMLLRMVVWTASNSPACIDSGWVVEKEVIIGNVVLKR